MKSNILLNVVSLSKTFKTPVYRNQKEGITPPDMINPKALDNINLSLKAGEKAALIGPDGSGKTTLLRLLAGLILPDGFCLKARKGENILSPVLINGFCPYKNLGEVKKIIGYMPQRFGLYEDLTVEENLELYAGLKNIAKNEKKEIFETLLKFAGLKDFKERAAGALSGGMKQKLGLSCTLLSKPKLLLLDEPSVGVDPVSRRDLIEITENLSKENNIGIIWATSYLDEAKYFDKVFLLSNGKKIYEGSTDSAKSAMEGLVCHTKDETKDNRIFLDEIVKNEKGIMDATIEGDKIRVVFDNVQSKEKFNHDIKIVEPVFEDFVMSALGGQKPVKEQNIKETEIEPPDNISINARNLTKVYKTKKGDFTAANKINFKVKKGEIYGLLGPNGAGKSTTFKMLCGLIQATSGESEIMGINLNINPNEAKKNFGYMAQKFSLFGNLSVRQNLEFFMGVYGVREDVKTAAENYELERYLEFNASYLPLGFKQRLALLCATIHNPPVLFLDEPTSGVDPLGRREFWMRINSLVKKKTTVLVTTHFMDEAQFCDRIALVYKGKILVEDTPDNLKKSVKTETLTNPSMEDAFVELIKRVDK